MNIIYTSFKKLAWSIVTENLKKKKKHITYLPFRTILLVPGMGIEALGYLNLFYSFPRQL